MTQSVDGLDAKREKKSILVGVRFGKSEFAPVQRLADELHISSPEAVRLLLREPVRSLIH